MRFDMIWSSQMRKRIDGKQQIPPSTQYHGFSQEVPIHSVPAKVGVFFFLEESIHVRDYTVFMNM